MDNVLEIRKSLIKKLDIMARRIDGINSFVLTGGEESRPSEINMTAGVDKEFALSNVYGDLNFLISEFFSTVKFEYTESESRIFKSYTLTDDINLKLTFCREDDFQSAAWWVCCFDKNGAAQSFYEQTKKYDADPEGNFPEEEQLQDDAADDDAALPPEPEEPQSEPPAEEKPDNDVVEGVVVNNFDDFTTDANIIADEAAAQSEADAAAIDWSLIYSKVSIAKGALAGGSFIRAGEIVNELRDKLVEIICRQNGVSDDYINSIDLLPNGYHEELAKTYPSKLETGAIVASLAAELALFEKLSVAEK